MSNPSRIKIKSGVPPEAGYYMIGVVFDVDVSPRRVKVFPGAWHGDSRGGSWRIYSRPDLQRFLDESPLTSVYWGYFDDYPRNLYGQAQFSIDLQALLRYELDGQKSEATDDDLLVEYLLAHDYAKDKAILDPEKAIAWLRDMSNSASIGKEEG